MNHWIWIVPLAIALIVGIWSNEIRLANEEHEKEKADMKNSADNYLSYLKDPGGEE